MKKLFTLFIALTVGLISYSQIVITEISYNGPEAGSDSTEFIELYNKTSSSINLTGYKFTSGVVYTFPNVSIAANGYLVIAVDSAAIMNVFGVSARQWTSGGLSNGGEPIALKDSSGNLIDSLRYDDNSPWPGGGTSAGSPDGGGATLVFCDTSKDNSLGANWKASTHTVSGKIVNGKQVYGSPGKVDSACTAGPPPPPSFPLYPIGTLTTNNSSGVADSNGVKCSIIGVVYGVDMAGTSSSNNQFTVIDATGGIQVFKFGGFTPSYTVTEGDSVIVAGTISQFNGLTQLSPDTMAVIKSNAALKSPTAVTSLGESTESDLVEIDSVKVINSSQWPSSGSNANVDIETTSGDTLVMRIDRDTDIDDSLTTAPVGLFKVIGLGGQFDASSPYTSGYQLLPRYRQDIVAATPPPPPPSSIPHYGLGIVTTEDTSGVADSINVKCAVSGVVHGIDMSGLSSSSNTFQLFDATGHVTVYKSRGFTPSYTVNESDSVTLWGRITQYNGLTQFTPDSIKVHKNGAGLKAWRKVTKLGEATESDYIRIDSVKLKDASQWPTIGNQNNVDIITQAGDTLTLRIDRDSYVDDSVAAPAGLFDVIGYGGQFDNSSPYTSGYQILPQLKNHIIVHPSATCNAPSALTTVSKTNVEIELGWTSGGSNTWNIEWGVMGSTTSTTTVFGNPNKFTGLLAATSYVFRVQDSCVSLGVSAWSDWDTIMTDAAAKVFPTYPISVVRTVDTDGVPDSLGVKCYLHGVVITPTYRRAGSGYEFHINDHSSPLNGINVIRFSGTDYVPRVGDSVRVFGEIDHYNGHIQMQTEADSIWVLDSNKTVPMPMPVTKLDETTESKLLQLEDWEIIDTTGWPTSNFGNFNITNGTDTFTMRMDGDRGWAANMPNPPIGKFCLVGVGGQFDPSKPHFGGYQILPRDTNDFIKCPVPCNKPTNLVATDSSNATSLTASWTTGGATSWNVGWAKGHSSTTPTDSVMAITTNPYTITGLDPNSHYHIWVQDVCGTNHSEWAGPLMVGTAVGINELTANRVPLVAFPNPNNVGEVRFNMEVSVTVRNILGQTVKTGNEVTSLNISDLESGVYLIQSEQGDTVRLIVE
ncbi:MAG: hypothetical protein CL840_09000 [Crocinitomicaceae bacterium]|nr:hypothetical protein [Crocinitomicaceae bacterium]|tara:strand:+ start:15961 stop:19251 length:3291 start_codon:yes stop_codon:yes gene_type:complete